MSTASKTGQPSEGSAFLQRLSSIPFPSVSILNPLADISPALQPSLAHEAHLRKLFAQDRSNASLRDPYVGLVDVHGDKAGFDVLKVRRRLVDKDATKERVTEALSIPLPGGPRCDATRSDEKYVLALPDSMRREHGEALCVDRQTFLSRFAVFTEGSLSTFTPDDWQNVLVAGGSVLACLLPVPASVAANGRRALRKFYHEESYVGSDIDLFIYGLNEEQAKVKMERLAEAIAEGIPWDTLCVRTKHAVTIVSQYPYRNLQVILRLYASPTEVLVGFDVDACSFGFDGQRVWATPRAVAAVMTQTNSVDMSRRSPSYEARLAKYADRGFEIHIPDLQRDLIDPSIFERGGAGVVGLARLLVLEKVAKLDDHEAYVDLRREARGRPPRTWQQRAAVKRPKANDWKASKGAKRGDWIEKSTYESSMIQQLPYGPTWDATRIQKLLYRNDILSNSKWNPKNKDFLGLHRHGAFFGQMSDVLHDCCQLCPKPTDDEQRRLMETLKSVYVSGPLSFMTENPGRQMMSGSFQPLDTDDWAEQAYLKPSEVLFSNIVNGRVQQVEEILVTKGPKAAEFLLERDPVGRSPLHLALLERQTEVALVLLKYGARMTSRLVDGRTAFHIAAAMGNVNVTREMLRISAENAKRAEEDRLNKKQTSNANDEDDDEDGELEDEDDGDVVIVKKRARLEPTEDISEDLVALLEPDVIDLSVATWDEGYTAMFYAVFSGSIETVQLLADAGASMSTIVKNMSLLSAALLIESDARASAMVQALVEKGARVNQPAFPTIGWRIEGYSNLVHLFLASRRTEVIVSLLAALRDKPLLLNSLACSVPVTYGPPEEITMHSPLSHALGMNQLGVAALLMSLGAKVAADQDDYDRLMETPFVKQWTQKLFASRLFSGLLRSVINPLEASLSSCNEGFRLLLAHDKSLPITATRNAFAFGEPRLTLVQQLRKTLEEALSDMSLSSDSEDDPTLLLSSLHIQRTSLAEARNLEHYIRICVYNHLRIDELHQEYSLLKKKDESTSREKGGEWSNESSFSDRPTMALKTQSYLAEVVSILAPRACEEWDDMMRAYGLDDRQLGKTGQQTDQFQQSFLPATPVSKTEHLTKALQRLEQTKVVFIEMTKNDYRPYGAKPLEISSRLVSRYTRLFQAVWEGDSAVVRKLTLPTPGESGPLLSASILLAEENEFARDFDRRTAHLLEIAVRRQQWSVLSTLFEVFEAQYEPEKPQEVRYTLGEETYYDSDDAELRIVAEPRDRSTIEEEGNESEYTHNMVSVKPVKSHIEPLFHLRRLFNEGNDCVFELLKGGHLEALRAIPSSLRLQYFKGHGVNSLEQALAVDNFDLLLFLAEHAMCFEHLQDEIVAAQEESDADMMEKPREYPGLLISGKRKAEWAAEADPTQRQQPRVQSIPILQKAVARGATNIVRKLLENNLAGVRQLLLAAQQGARTYLSESEGGMQRKGLEALLSCDTDDQKVIRKAAGLDTKDHRNLLQALALQDVKLQTTNVATLQVIVDLLPAYVDEHLNEPEQSGEMLTPLLNAVASRCDIAIVQALIDCGAHLETRDKLGRNVLFHAVKEHQQRNHLKPEEELQYLENVLKLLPTGIANALAMQQATNLGLPADTVLHAAKHTSKIRLLLDKLVPQTVRELLLRRNEFGQTPLAQAVSRNEYNIFKLLLEACKQHNVLQVLRWEDATGDTPLERVERLVIRDALNDHPARTVIDPPLQFMAKIDQRFVSGRGVNPNNNLIAMSDWKTIVTRLTDWESESKGRRYQLDIDDQIAELQYVLHEAAGLLTPELREACEDLLVRLQTKQKERWHDSSHPTARSLGSEPLFNDDTKQGTGINSHLRLIRWALIEAEKSYTGSKSRVKMPVTNLQLAAKARLDVRDKRYEISEDGLK